jgi:hypothetical protein
MQKKFSFQPLGPADGSIKNAIFGENEARLYNYERHGELATRDRFSVLKAKYEQNGPGRSNLRYGYVARPT